MSFRWRKLGLLYYPNGDRHPKLLTHAANPVALPLTDTIYRIFFCSRDEKNRSSIGAVDIDLDRKVVVQGFYEPFFTYGSAGTFYADGVTLGNWYQVDGTTYLLFMGWQNPIGKHWRGDIGRLILENNEKFYLDKDQPLLGTSEADPISLSYPCVYLIDDRYYMWYGSTITWDAGNGEMLHVINYAYSADGHTWHPQGLAVPYEVGKAQAFSRPAVIRIGNCYHMWFSYRGGSGQKYRIGYAYSLDGVHWTLELEKAGIDVSDQGWDSEMIEYPFIFLHKGEYYMLYNGNGYGKTGFGLAVLEEYKDNG
jgi:hypothetical protein